MTASVLTDEALDRIFRTARTAHAWLDRPVGDDLLRQIYDLTKWGPTSANGCPLRIVFVKTQEGKERLKPALIPANVAQTMAAPVTAILAYDTQFYDLLPKLYPHTDARAWFAGNDKAIYDTAFCNSSLQAGYFIVALRALGLDEGAMSGFDEGKVNKEFFPDGRFKVNFLCNLGYADRAKSYARGPRLTFEEACQFA